MIKLFNVFRTIFVVILSANVINYSFISRLKLKSGILNRQIVLKLFRDMLYVAFKMFNKNFPIIHITAPS